MAIPVVTRRFGNPATLAGGLVIAVVGMAWLSRLGPDTPYLTGIALPMVLIGIGQGGTLGPLTAGGLAGVAAEDAGAAHRIGASLTAGAVLLGLALVIALAGLRPARGRAELAVPSAA